MLQHVDVSLDQRSHRQQRGLVVESRGQSAAQRSWLRITFLDEYRQCDHWMSGEVADSQIIAADVQIHVTKDTGHLLHQLEASLGGLKKVHS